jgi:hypothetical protein
MKLIDLKGLWILIAPIVGVRFYQDSKGEFEIGKTLVISGEKLKRKRKIFNHNVSVKKLLIENKIDPNFISDERTYVISCEGNIGSKAKDIMTKRIREDLDILALSQLSGSRKHNSKILIAKYEDKNFFEHVLLNPKIGKAVNSSKRIGSFGFFNIAKQWHTRNDSFYFTDLLKIIFKESSAYNNNWRNDIKRAAILAGQSQQSEDIVKAFIWNIIAIETLVIEQNDKISVAIPERIGSLISWFPNWELDNFIGRIEKMYKKRCGFVHAAKYDDITQDDLIFSDQLIINILINVVKNIKHFNRKEALIKFSEMNKARKLLGLKHDFRKYDLHYISL